VTPQRKPKTPTPQAPKAAPDKVPDASGRRMNAEELEECRRLPVIEKAATPQHYVDQFDHFARRIREIVHQFAYSPDARSLAAHFDTWHSAVGFARDGARTRLRNCPTLPEVPDLIGNDYYAGMIRLADYCTMAAKRLCGKANKPPLTERAAIVLDILKALPSGRAMMLPAILDALAERDPPIHLDQGTLTGKIMPVLKEHYDVDNKPRVGYFVKPAAQ